MPAMSKFTALACTVAGAIGGAAFVQPGAVRAPAQPRAAAAGLQRWEPATEAEAQAAEEGFPAKGFLAGLALGLGVALAGAQHAQAAAAAPKKAAPPPITDMRDSEYKNDKDFEAIKSAVAKQANKPGKDGVGLQTWKYGRDYDKKYTQISTGAGNFLRYNLGNYQIIPSYRGTPNDDGKYIIDPRQIELARLQQIDGERIKNEVAPKWLKDGGKTGNIWPSQGMYKPRTYTSAYEPVRQK